MKRNKYYLDIVGEDYTMIPKIEISKKQFSSIKKQLSEQIKASKQNPEDWDGYEFSVLKFKNETDETNIVDYIYCGFRGASVNLKHVACKPNFHFK